MTPPFSAVLLTGGKSSRMGRDKALIDVGGVPLWRRQLRTLQELWPAQIFVAGPPRPEWIAAALEIVPDAEEGTGPLAGLVASLRRCSTPLLLALAVDLPNMNSDYLTGLLQSCAVDRGIVPVTGDRFEPLAAVYPVASLPLGESLLRLGRFSVQDFCASSIAQQLMVQTCVSPGEERLFLNLNTPQDCAAMAEGEPDTSGLP